VHAPSGEIARQRDGVADRRDPGVLDHVRYGRFDFDERRNLIVFGRCRSFSSFALWAILRRERQLDSARARRRFAETRHNDTRGGKHDQVVPSAFVVLSVLVSSHFKSRPKP